MKRLLYALGILAGAALSWGQGYSGGGGGTVTSPIATDPMSATGVWTFNNAANTPVTCSDGLIDSTLTSGRVTFGGASGRLSDDADLTFVDDTLTVTKGAVKAGTGSGVLSLGGVLCKGVGIATTGTVEEVLATCALPAGTLSANGATLRVSVFLHTAANANSKSFAVRVGGLAGAITYSSGGSAANNLNIIFPGAGAHVIQRTGATTATAQGYANAHTDKATTAMSVAFAAYLDRAVSITWANALDLVITGTTPTAAGDLTLDSYLVEVVQ